MVDVHVVAHLRDSLVPGLRFSPYGNSAESVRSSKLVKLRAEAYDRFFLAAGQVIGIRLVGDCWLQSGTVRFAAQLFNNSTNASNPVAPPGCMFRTMIL